MALQVFIYTVEARKRDETPYPASELWWYEAKDADAYAKENRLRVIENEYTWEDSEMIGDYTPDVCRYCGAEIERAGGTWEAATPGEAQGDPERPAWCPADDAPGHLHALEEPSQ